MVNLVDKRWFALVLVVAAILMILTALPVLREWILGQLVVEGAYASYTTASTILYASLLLASLVLLERFVKHRIEINEDYVLGFFPFLVPYIVLGSCLRSLRDAGVLTSNLLVTPRIYVLVAGFTISALSISWLLSRLVAGTHVVRARWPFGIIGLLSAGSVVYVVALNVRSLERAAVALVMFALLSCAIIPVAYFLVPRKADFWQTRLNSLIIIGQLLDATAAFVAVAYYGSHEQTLLMRAMLEISRNAFFLIVLKLGAYFTALGVLDLCMKRRPEFSSIVMLTKSSLLILGFATGLRDLFTMCLF